MRRIIALLICAAMGATGCAPALARGSAPARDPAVHAAVIAYLQHQTPGARLRIRQASGRTVRGILLELEPDGVIVQEHGRDLEPPLPIALDTIVAVEPDRDGSHVGKAIAIGAGVAGGVIAAFLFWLRFYHNE
ncbi:MAG TPA: hypothetical protein VFX12_06245 [Vicinamibacterales bacterium]|nr:hypothetical protein [Vicinamibacterales bacterium]